MGTLFNSFITGYMDIYRLSPFSLDADPGVGIDFDALPGPEQDAANLAGDWQRVGGYFRNAMATVKKQYNLPDFDSDE